MLDDDLSVFFDTDDFAHVCTPSRAGVPGTPFAGVLGTVDESLFDGHITAGTHALRFATASAQLLPGDLVVTQATVATGTSPPSQTWRVHRPPERVVDGAESECWLVPVGGA